MTSPHSANTMSWHTRPETPADIPAIRTINLLAFPTPYESSLVDALRASPSWVDLSFIAFDALDYGTPIAHALLTRCTINTKPALALAPVAVVPAMQRKGAGSAVIRAALQAARERGETAVVVLGHPGYYPRFGFEGADKYGVKVGFGVGEGALMVLALGEGEVPSGVVEYPPEFGL